MQYGVHKNQSQYFHNSSCTVTRFLLDLPMYKRWLIDFILPLTTNARCLYMYSIKLLILSTLENGQCANHGHFFWHPISENFSRGQFQMKDDYKTNRKLLFWYNMTHWISLLFIFSRTRRRSTATKETKFVMFVVKLNFSHLNNIRNADSRAGYSLTNCR